MTSTIKKQVSEHQPGGDHSTRSILRTLFFYKMPFERGFARISPFKPYKSNPGSAAVQTWASSGMLLDFP